MKLIVQSKVLSKEIGWAASMLKYREGMQDLSVALRPFCRKQASKEPKRKGSLKFAVNPENLSLKNGWAYVKEEPCSLHPI